MSGKKALKIAGYQAKISIIYSKIKQNRGIYCDFLFILMANFRLALI
jgi:hypothetical protein